MTLPVGGTDPSVGDLVTAAFLGALNDSSVITASGAVSITPVANTFTSATVTFPVGRFASAPIVVCVAIAAGTGSISFVGLNGTPVAASCSIGVTRTNTTVTVVHWLALLSP